MFEEETVYPSPIVTYTGIALTSFIFILLLIDLYTHLTFNNWVLTKTRAVYYAFSISFISIEFATVSLYHSSSQLSCLIFFGTRAYECIMPIVILWAYFVWSYDFCVYRAYGMKANGLIKYGMHTAVIILCVIVLIVQIIIVSFVMTYNTPIDCSANNPHKSPLYNVTILINICEMALLVVYIIAYLGHFFLTHKDFRFSFKSSDGKQYIIFFIRFILATIILVLSLSSKVLAFIFDGNTETASKIIFSNQVPFVIQFVAQLILTFNTSQWTLSTKNEYCKMSQD